MMEEAGRWWKEQVLEEKGGGREIRKTRVGGNKTEVNEERNRDKKENE